jgi:hypothetical protein
MYFSDQNVHVVLLNTYQTRQDKAAHVIPFLNKKLLSIVDSPHRDGCPV